MNIRKILLLALCIIFITNLIGCGTVDYSDSNINNLDTSINTNDTSIINEDLDGSGLYASNYSGEPFMVINNNIPYFTEEEKSTTEVFEKYSDLDSLGRCGVAYANVCQALTPTEDRESLSSVTPSGWKNKSYDFVDGGWLYNRAHIIGFQLAGEQANELNLITGTRYMNVSGMLPFENMVADYIKESDGNHVLYRVTPVYNGNNLVAEGVIMEGWSIEDAGESICFNVFCFNVQDGVEIDYATGDNWLKEGKITNENIIGNSTYILNTNSKKFHNVDCSGVSKISDKNKKEYVGDRNELIAEGYSSCGICKP